MVVLNLRSVLSTNLVFAACMMSVLAGAYCSLLLPLNIDSAWLITAASHILAGERLYIDIVETNPPLAVWLHLVPAKVAAVFNLSLHSAFTLYMSVLMSGSIWLVSRLKLPSLLTLAYALSITVLVNHDIGQREHLFIVLAAPYFLTLLSGRSPSPWLAIPAALGIALKPFFIMIPIIFALAYAFKLRSWQAIFLPSHLIILFFGLIYIAYLYLDQTYLQEVAAPMLQLYYFKNIADSIIAISLAAALTLLLIPYGMSLLNPSLQRLDCLTLFLSALAGIWIVYLQSKGFRNHYYIYYFFSFMLCWHFVALGYLHRQQFRGKLLMLVSATSLFLYLLYSLSIMRGSWLDVTHHFRSMELAIDTIRGDSLYTFTFDLSTAFPIAPDLQLNFVGRYPNFWFLPAFYLGEIQSEGAEPDYRRAKSMSALERRYYNAVIEDFITKKPDIVLVSDHNNYFHPVYDRFGFDFIRYYSQNPRFAAAWRHYDFVTKVEDTAFYRRKPD